MRNFRPDMIGGIPREIAERSDMTNAQVGQVTEPISPAVSVQESPYKGRIADMRREIRSEQPPLSEDHERDDVMIIDVNKEARKMKTEVKYNTDLMSAFSGEALALSGELAKSMQDQLSYMEGFLKVTGLEWDKKMLLEKEIIRVKEQLNRYQQAAQISRQGQRSIKTAPVSAGVRRTVSEQQPPSFGRFVSSVKSMFGRWLGK